ncbi:MAG: amino acid permease [Phycisphaeraceae bacterium]|nr:amino acid permease [Phycisphaeraceae bacterium]
MPPAPHLERSIGLWGGIAIMTGIMIGGGIFQTPGEIAANLGDPWLILLLWVAGGLLALFGGLTYAELAGMHPESGGVYVFLREGYGRCVAFVFGWTYLLITKPLGAAGIAIIFANHFVEVAGLPRPVEDTPPYANSAVWTTMVLLTVLTAINVRGVRLGTAIAMALTSFKFLVLAAIVVLGLALGGGVSENLARGTIERPGLLAALVPVMAAILWTYDGWNDVASVAGEVRNPGRTLARVFFVGTGAIIAVYLAVNAVYMWLIPLDEMAGKETVAPMVVERLVGGGAGVIVAVVIMVSTLGSTHGSILTGARVSYAQAKDGLLFAFLARVHPRHHTPAVSLWVQLLLSCLAVWFLGSFERLAGGFVFSMWIFYGLAGAAIFVLRVRRPRAERPYRCWGYPVVPALFVLSAAGMTALTIWQDVEDSGGRDTLPWLGVLAAGAPVYFVWEAVKGRRRKGSPES